MKTLTLLFISTLSLTLFGQKSFQISGKINGFVGKTKAYLYYNDSDEDSCQVENGFFKFTGKMRNGPDYASLVFRDEASKTFYFFFAYEGSIFIEGEKKQLPYLIKYSGDPINRLNDKNQKMAAKLWIKRNDITNNFYKWKGTPAEAGNIEKMKMIDKKVFAIEKQNNLPKLNTYFGVHWLFSYKNKFSKKHIKILFKNIPKSLANYRYTKLLKNYISIEKLKIGDTFRDFSAMDQVGNTHQFSDYFKGKYVLLDFTSYHCGVCHLAEPEIKAFAEKFNDKVKVISFLTDQNETDWPLIRKLYPEPWLILWDKQGIYGETPAQYSIMGTPNFFFFDSSGKILDISEGFAEGYFSDLERLIK